MSKSLTKEELIAKIRDLLKTDDHLDFLLELKRQDVEKLVACVRDRLEGVK